KLPILCVNHRELIPYGIERNNRATFPGLPRLVRQYLNRECLPVSVGGVNVRLLQCPSLKRTCHGIIYESILWKRNFLLIFNPFNGRHTSSGGTVSVKDNRVNRFFLGNLHRFPSGLQIPVGGNRYAVSGFSHINSPVIPSIQHIAVPRCVRKRNLPVPVNSPESDHTPVHKGQILKWPIRLIEICRCHICPGMIGG